MKKVFFMFFTVLLLSLVMISAEPAYVFKKDQSVDLCIPVYNANNSKADSGTSCTFTLQKPRTLDLLIHDQNMSFNTTGIFCYSINDTFLDTTGEYPISIACDNTQDYSFTSFTAEVTISGSKVSLSNIIIVLVFLVLCGMFIWIGSSFSNEKFIIRTGFYLFAILMGVLAINSARIITSESIDLDTMGQAGFILIMAVLLFMFLYIFIFSLINVFRQVKNKNEINWRT